MNTERSSALALAAVFSGSGQPFRLEEFPIPKPGPGEILVDITCSTICGSDLHTWHGRRQEPTPCVLGHEIVGRIVSFGARAPRIDLKGDTLTEGDRITWTIAASCGDCFFCRRGLPQKCEHLFKYGHNAIAPGRVFSGGFAECCILTGGTGIVKLPNELTDMLAAPANCAVSTVAAAMRLAGPIEGSTVAILGCGVLGMNAVAMARFLGAEKVIACDLSASRSTLASRFGADHFATPDQLLEHTRDLTEGRGADITLEFSGAASAVSGAITATRTGGTTVIAGITTPGCEIHLDANELVRRMLTIRGLHNYGPEDLVSAVDFLTKTSASVPFAELTGGEYALENIEHAFEFSSSSPGQRIAVKP
jgi:putative phosphonate catabolism associated alcohol dehydrogenase